MEDPYITTATGGRIHLTLERFDPEAIDFEDVLLGLPHINRYNGRTLYPHSVAHHTLNLSEAMRLMGAGRIMERWAFIHDWFEYVIGDLIAPVRVNLPWADELESRALRAIAIRNGLPPVMPPGLLDYDKRIRRNEMDVFGPPHTEKWWLRYEPLPYLSPWHFRQRSVESVRSEFAKRAEELGVR
jgi:5'-deoxynucleotidase YfbR-like HD superfamily hydrolase